MFQRLTNLFFGKNDETSKEDVLSKGGPLEMDEDDWLFVSWPEGETCSEHSSETPFTSACRPHTSQLSTENSASTLISDSSTSGPEVPVARSSTPGQVYHGLLFQTGALAKVTQLSRVQHAQARADRHLLGRRCIRRRNYVQQRVPHHTARKCPNLIHQPGHRNLSR